MRKQFDIPRIAEGLTTYAIERQNGFERYQPAEEPPWAEQRRSWINAVLQGMAELDGEDLAPEWMKQYDQQLREASGRYFIVPATLAAQRDTICALGRFVNALEATGQDRREQVQIVDKLMTDIYSHHPWSLCAGKLGEAFRQPSRALMRMTAQRPIRFTYVVMSGYPVSCQGDFVPGVLKDTEAVQSTELYQKMTQWHPKQTRWLVSCSVYHGGNGLSQEITDATDFDMRIIRSDEYRFLKQPGLRFVSHWESDIPSLETVIRDPGEAPQWGSQEL